MKTKMKQKVKQKSRIRKSTPKAGVLASSLAEQKFSSFKKRDQKAIELLPRIGTVKFLPLMDWNRDKVCMPKKIWTGLKCVLILHYTTAYLVTSDAAGHDGIRQDQTVWTLGAVPPAAHRCTSCGRFARRGSSRRSMELDRSPPKSRNRN